MIYSRVKENIQIAKINLQRIQEYKALPQKLYGMKHTLDGAVEVVLCEIEKFYGQIIDWLNKNSILFDQRVKAFEISKIALDTFQILIDVTVKWKQRCGTCRVDSYDLHSFLTALLSFDIPILKIPPFRLPNFNLDFSNIKV